MRGLVIVYSTPLMISPTMPGGRASRSASVGAFGLGLVMLMSLPLQGSIVGGSARRRSCERDRAIATASLWSRYSMLYLESLPLLDAVLLELVVQRRGLDAEQAGGLGLDPARLGVRLEDQLALEVVEDLGQRQLARHVEPILLGAALQELRQRGRRDLLALGEHQRLLDRVLELADVARPVIRHDPAERGVADRADPRVGLRRELGDEVRAQPGDVLAALAQRRQLDREHVEPEEQILAEPARRHLGL